MKEFIINNTVRKLGIHQIFWRMRRQSFTLFFLFIFGISSVFAQKTITGTVKDVKGIPLPGVTVLIKGTTTGTITNLDGVFSIRALPTEVLVVSFMGFISEEVLVGDQETINFELEEDLVGIEEITVVGFGTQKKTSMVSSISTISAKELKTSSSNLTTALAGKISGMISYQRSGEPGQDNAEFFIRGLSSFGTGKVDPLILIDGIESSQNDMARLQPDDIATFSVLKDATAAAVYGARGANGVVLITTKAGKAGRTKFDFRVENRISSNTQNIKLADNITYMNLANEAALTSRVSKNPILPYSNQKIQHTMDGDDPYLYPNNDFIDQLVKDRTMNQAYNLSASGGSEKARYYVAGTYNIDNGILKVDPINNFNSNISLKNYSIRTNINLQLTKTTEAIVRMYGQFDDYNGPIGGGSRNYNNALWANPVKFPTVYPSEYLPYVEHPLFGGAVTGIGSEIILTNPYAEMVKGYQVHKSSNMQPQFEFKQDLNMVLPGLSARAMTYVKRYSYFELERFYDPFYYEASVSPVDGSTMLRNLNDGGANSIGTVGTETLDYREGDKKVNSQLYLEAAANYNHSFNDKHDVTGMLIFLASEFTSGNEGDLTSSLPKRNMGVSGRFTYGYNTRYMAEFNFGYNGTEKFAANHRYGFFPSVGLGYLVSNEDYFLGLKNILSNLKLRASFGLIGNDQIGNDSERFFYLSDVRLNDGTYGAIFGEDRGTGYYRDGVSIRRYANENISWEKSKQINLGADLQLFNSVDIIIDVYKQHRTNILQSRSDIGSTMGLLSSPKTNFGEVRSHGIDLDVNYNKSFMSGLFAIARGNFTYASNEYAKVDEVNYPENEYYRTRIGNSTKQRFGFVAERLFVDDVEAANAPTQFGEYGGGDIKYHDMNGDGTISAADMVPIGHPTVPEIVYGFGGTIGYKDFDISFYFQGVARTSIFIDPVKISPFVLSGGLDIGNNTRLSQGAQTGLLEVIADDHWSEDNRNLYAFWPRLSDTWVNNNLQASTWWMRNGSFLRLKSVEAGYNVPNDLISKFKLQDLRIYFTATNLFVLSKFKLWDPEMGSSGLGYPIQSVYSMGIKLAF